MNDLHDSADLIRQASEKILAEWADQGKIIEGGWQAMVLLSHLKDAPEELRRQMRKAYMMGAHHLFSSIVSMLDEDREPTARDLRRMDLIHKELEKFRKSLVN